MDPLTCVTSIDGRYHDKTAPLSAYFSEHALFKYRCQVEIEYFLALGALGAPFTTVSDEDTAALRTLYEQFSIEDSRRIKGLEAVTNHDVKAVEYFIKQRIAEGPFSADLKAPASIERIHFGLTSQDINNVAIPLSLKAFATQAFLPALRSLLTALTSIVSSHAATPMLAHTHGQAATPTTVGKEFAVFSARLRSCAADVEEATARLTAKFGGATGALNAHKVAYPSIDWLRFADSFISSQGLVRSRLTTQIDTYDSLAAFLHATVRVCSVLLDLSRDCWLYIHKGYLAQAVVGQEVGSSAMPHKVNPIDFENAEGNLGVATASLEHLAGKLPVSRMQRDLSDSTVLRTLGTPFAHVMVSLASLRKGLGRVSVNTAVVAADLEANFSVVAEAVQTILRREGVEGAYEILKNATRTGAPLTRSDMEGVVGSLDVSQAVKAEILSVSPSTFLGFAAELAHEEAALGDKFIR